LNPLNWLLHARSNPRRVATAMALVRPRAIQHEIELLLRDMLVQFIRYELISSSLRMANTRIVLMQVQQWTPHFICQQSIVRDAFAR
jgi:hypothetical protein